MEREAVACAGRSAGADLIVDAHILDYGVVRWQYAATGLVVHASAELLAVGLASAWNPVALGAWAAFDITTDIPLWFGGAQVSGWAFRPVRIQIHALQIEPCEGMIWTEQELVLKVPGKTLEEYAPEQQRRKEVQLNVNLDKALAALAERAGKTLTRQPCAESGQLDTISNFSVWSVLDFLY